MLLPGDCLLGNTPLLNNSEDIPPQHRWNGPRGCVAGLWSAKKVELEMDLGILKL